MKEYLILILFCPLFLVAQVCETIYPSEYADSIQYCVTDASCHNTCDGSIVVNVFGSNQPYYFEWNNSNVAIAGDNSRSNLCASSHIITITDSSGNLVNNTQVNNLEEPTNFSVFEIVNDPTCYGYSDGSIDLTIGGSVPFSTSPSYLYSWDDGVNTEDRASLSSGVYILTITDANGCNRIDTFNIVDPLEVSVATIGDTLSCISSCDGQAIVSPISGVAPFTFVWDNPIVPSNDTVSNLCYGLSTVLVTDANGCFITDSVFIDNPDTLMVSSVIVDSACYQMCDGEISVNIQGGVSPYIVTWTLNQIVIDTLNTTISDLCSDTYTLTYIDANNCANTLDIFLAERDSFNLVSSVIDDSCYNSCKGQISVNLLNPNSPPFIYNWSNGSIGNIASNLCSDSINLELIDNSGCRDTFYYFIDHPLELSFDSVSIINNVCYADINGSITINVSGGTGVVSALWSSNNFSSNDEDIFNLSSGTYNLHIEDQNLCFKDTTFLINEPDSLYSIHSVQDATCYSYSDGMIDLTIQGGTVPYLINWSNILSNSLNVDSLSAGDYIYFIVDSNGCSFSDTAIINHPDEIIIIDSIVDVLCFGYHSGIIDLSVSGGTLPYSYVWSNGDSTQDLYNVKSDSYNVLVTDNNGCIDTDNFVVSQPLFPITFQIDGEDVLCFGGSTGGADLSVSGGTAPYLYSWSNAETTQDINDLVAGTYGVTIIDDNGCDTTGSVDILENASILTNYNTNDVLCFGDTTGVIDIISTSGGTSPFTYDFSNGFSSSVPANLVVPSGLYFLLVTDINMCTESIQFLISEPSQMSSNITFENIDCFGNVNGSIDLSVSGGVDPYTYLWSNNESFEDISNLPSGYYSVIVTDSNNCQISDSANISQPLEIVVSAQISDAICHGNSDGFIDLSASGGTGTLSYLWSNGSVSEDIFNVSSGFYSVDVIDVNNCIFSQSYLVSEPLAYLPYFDVMDVMCFGDATGSINLTISGNNPPYSYVWDNGSNTEDVSNLLAGDYSVMVTDVNNCIESFDVSIVHPTELILQYTVYDATCEENNDGSILTNVSGGTFPYAYFWSNGLYDSDLYNLSKGIYSLEIRDANSCIYPIENIEVSFDGFDGCIEIPTGFTPNGDGIHDEWAIYGLYNFPDVIVNVHNRWGQRVFFSEGYDVPWDGRHNGVELPISTYYYIIELVESGKIFNGTVTIKR